MAPTTAVWLLLGLGSLATASPIDGLQKVLSPSETGAQTQRKLNGKFLHITGMCDSVGRRSTRTRLVWFLPAMCCYAVVVCTTAGIDFCDDVHELIKNSC